MRSRLPRRTIRLRLALLYGGVFFISGAILLALIYAAVAHTHHAYSQVVPTPFIGSSSSQAATAQLQPAVRGVKVSIVDSHQRRATPPGPGRVRMADRRAGTAPAANDHDRRPGHIRNQLASAPRVGRP